MVELLLVDEAEEEEEEGSGFDATLSSAPWKVTCRGGSPSLLDISDSIRVY